MPLVLLLTCLLVMTVVVTWGVRVQARETRERNEHMLRQWLAAAQALGLQASGDGWQRTMQGVVRGVPVRIDFAHEQSTTSKGTAETTTFQAGNDGHIPASIALRQTPVQLFGSSADAAEPATGDERFDALTELAKMDAYVCAALSEEARRHLGAIVHGGGGVWNGVVTWRVQGHRTGEQRWLTERIDFIAAVANLLSVNPDTLAQRLAQNAVHDSDPEARQQNLLFLLAPETHAAPELVTATARALIGDPQPLVRVRAARQLGAEGHATLLALLKDVQAEMPLRAVALAALHEGNADDIDEWIASFLAPSPAELTRAALVIVAARSLSVHLDRVLDLTSASDASLRAAAARTLSALESPLIEPRLLELLADDEEEVQVAAAEALGRIGDIATVEPLLSFTRRFGRTPLREAARDAIARIQSRLGDVEAGRVSLAEDELAGAVALVDEQVTGGEITLASGSEEPEKVRTTRG